MMESRRKRNLLPHRMTLWFSVLSAVAVAYLTNHPLPVDSEIPSESSVELTREAHSDVVVVIDYKAIKESGDTFKKRDFSFAWVNLFEQEVGPVSIATPASLNAEMLGEARILVLTQSVSKSVPEPLVKKIRERVLTGELLLVQELPGGALRERFAANGEVGTREGVGITYVRGLPEPYHRQLLAMPVASEYMGSTAPRERALTLLAIDGAPVIYALALGKGHVITVDFDFGEQMVALQQGRPTNDFEVHPKSGDTPQTTDLVLGEEMLGSDVPYADLLERFILHGVLAPYMPIASFWLYPGGAAGAVVPIHQDDQLGDGGAWMLRQEIKDGGSSTLLSTSDSGLSAAGSAVIHRLGGELGLIWRLPDSPSAHLESFGVGSLTPFARAVSFESQYEDLVDTIPSDAIFSAMTHQRYWTTDWTAPFRALASKSVRIDASYSGGTAAGYAFGTGLPFLVVDSDGLPLSIRELPIVVPDRADSGPKLAELLKASSDGHHQAIPVSVSPARFAAQPDLNDFESWMNTHALAEQYDHGITSARRLDVFMRARRAGVIRTTQRIPRPEEALEGAKILRIVVEAKRRGLYLMVPGELDGKPFLTAKQSANRVGEELVSGELETKETRYIGIPMRLIPLWAGFNTIDVVYR